MTILDTDTICKKIKSCKKGLGGYPIFNGKIWIAGGWHFEIKDGKIDKSGLCGEYDFDESLFDFSCLKEEEKTVEKVEFKISSHIPKLKKNNVKQIDKYRQYLADRQAESKTSK